MTTGVVVMTYGTPARREEIEDFYTDVRLGRSPTPEQLAELERRYNAIGGLSPLTARSAAQVGAIAEALEALAPGAFVVRYGTKHAHPRLEEAVDELVAAGVDSLVGLVLAPHYSAFSVGEYLERLRSRAGELGLAHVTAIEHFGEDEVFVDLLAQRVTDRLEALSIAAEKAEVLFSAHSLPERILECGDPYPRELANSAALVARRAALIHWRSVWQSASPSPEAWLGPDISAVLEELAAEGTEGVVVCPIGFTADHLEVLYDLDIVARRRCDELGLAYSRTESLNDEGRLMDALARLVFAASPLGS